MRNYNIHIIKIVSFQVNVSAGLHFRSSFFQNMEFFAILKMFYLQSYMLGVFIDFLWRNIQCLIFDSVTGVSEIGY